MQAARTGGGAGCIVQRRGAVSVSRIGVGARAQQGLQRMLAALPGCEVGSRGAPLPGGSLSHLFGICWV